LSDFDDPARSVGHLHKTLKGVKGVHSALDYMMEETGFTYRGMTEARRDLALGDKTRGEKQ
jgi:hypothetical protein